MASLTQVRRSCRIATHKFNEGLIFTSCNADQTALILTLAQQSGWTADHIALSLMEADNMKGKSRILAEDLWTFFSRWATARAARRSGVNTFTAEEQSIMDMALKAAGIVLTSMGSPLNETVRPNTVLYNTVTWVPNVNGVIVPSFTRSVRVQSKMWLMGRSEGALAKPTPAEEESIKAFGETTEMIFKDVMKRWAKAMHHKLQNPNDRDGLKPLEKKEHVNLILEYMQVYASYYETKFGKLEYTPQVAGKPVNMKTDADKPINITVRSTGFAGQIFFGLLLADRLDVVDHLRKLERRRLGFIPVDVEDLESDQRDCKACHDELGAPNEEGLTEDPIRIVICCHQVIGKQCMRLWLARTNVYNKIPRRTCPVCRYKLPDTFIEKLFEGYVEVQEEGEKEEEDEEEESEEDEGHDDPSGYQANGEYERESDEEEEEGGYEENNDDASTATSLGLYGWGVSNDTLMAEALTAAEPEAQVPAVVDPSAGRNMTSAS